MEAVLPSLTLVVLRIVPSIIVAVAKVRGQSLLPKFPQEYDPLSQIRSGVPHSSNYSSFSDVATSSHG